MYINMYFMDLFLCIVLEFYFKCLCVGGVEWVFEFGCVFCNEGVDFSYNLEFILLEVY